MFQLILGQVIQADREREIAERVRQRRLLEPDIDGQDRDESTERCAEPRAPHVRAQAAGS